MSTPDWSWRPDATTRSALANGARKIRGWDPARALPSPRTVPDAAAKAEVAVYLQRIQPGATLADKRWRETIEFMNSPAYKRVPLRRL